MARQNHISLLGIVTKAPRISKTPEGEYKAAISFLRVTRSERDAGDRRTGFKDDEPVIMTQDPLLAEQISKWQANDAIYVKGVLSTRMLEKHIACEHCHERNGYSGMLIYISPIHILKVQSFADEASAIAFLHDHREISNEVQVVGTVVRDPKKITPKTGLIVTQYPIAMNRKYKIKTDPAEFKTDYPWIKAYGPVAMEDRKRLHVGSEILVDGCLQARNFRREKLCDFCKEKFVFKDRTMEIVPFATEYLTGTYTDEEIVENERIRYEQAVRDAFAHKLDNEDVDISQLRPDYLPDDEITEEDIKNGYDETDKG